MGRKPRRPEHDESALADWLSANLPRVGTSGEEYLTECPWCGRPKLYANPIKNVFNCRRCDEAGSLYRLIAHVEGVSFRDAKRRVRPVVTDLDELTDAMRMLDIDYRPQEEEVVFVHPLPDEFHPCFDGDTWRIPQYLTAPPPRGRGLTKNMIVKHGLGFCRKGKYRDRVFFPVVTGPHRTWQARLMGKETDFEFKTKSGDIFRPSKYVSPRNGGLSHCLYWYDHYEHGCPLLIVVEGILDAMRLISLGYPAVASMGKHLSDVQIGLLLEKEPRKVILLRDKDAELDSIREAHRIRQRSPRFELMVAFCHSGDPDSIGYHEGRPGIDAVLRGARAVGSDVDELSAMLDVLA